MTPTETRSLGAALAIAAPASPTTPAATPAALMALEPRNSRRLIGGSLWRGRVIGAACLAGVRLSIMADVPFETKWKSPKEQVPRPLGSGRGTEKLRTASRRL